MVTLRSLVHWIPFFVYFFASTLLITHNHLWARYPKIGQHITIATFFVYIIAINWLCLTPAMFNFGTTDKIMFYFHGVPFNIIPLQGVSQEFFLNIVMTFPLGVYIYLADHRLALARAALYGFCFSLFIEVNQFVCDLIFHIGRVADIDDLICNTAGVIVGFGVMIILDQGIFHQIIKHLMLKGVKSDTLDN